MQVTTCDYTPTNFPPVRELSYINPTKGHRSGEGLDFLNSVLYKEWAKRPSSDIVMERFMQNLEKRHYRLLEIFEQKLPSHLVDFQGIDLDLVRQSTRLAAYLCLLTNPQRFTVDFTEDASVVLTLRYADGKDAYIEMYFEPNIMEPIQCVVFLSANKQNIFAYNGAFGQGLTAFIQEMQPISIQIPT